MRSDAANDCWQDGGWRWVGGWVDGRAVWRERDEGCSSRGPSDMSSRDRESE